jgi:hypothetical protein
MRCGPSVEGPAVFPSPIIAAQSLLNALLPASLPGFSRVRVFGVHQRNVD